MENGKLVFKQSEAPVHTDEKSKWIFVLSTTRSLYVGQVCITFVCFFLQYIKKCYYRFITFHLVVLKFEICFFGLDIIEFNVVLIFIIFPEYSS